jgi:hypothetical protein
MLSYKCNWALFKCMHYCCACTALSKLLYHKKARQAALLELKKKKTALLECTKHAMRPHAHSRQYAATA